MHAPVQRGCNLHPNSSAQLTHSPVPLRRVHRRVATASVVDSVKNISSLQQIGWQHAGGVSRLVDEEGSPRVSLPQLDFPDLKALEHKPCPCGSMKMYQSCCGRLHAGAVPHHAAELARSRFTAHLLGNLLHLEETLHPDSPDQARPQLLAKACHVFQSLQPRLLDMCHGTYPDVDASSPETHVVATALLIQRDMHSLPCVYLEVDSYRMHNGQWMWYHKEQQMPTFGSFTIFWDKYGPGQQGGSDKDPGRYRFDLVDPRRTPAARRTPNISRNPTPQQLRRPGTPALGRLPTTPSSSALRAGGTPSVSRQSPTPQPRRTPALARKPTPGAERWVPSRAGTWVSDDDGALLQNRSPTPQSRTPPLASTPSPGLPGTSSDAASTALTTTASIHQWLMDSDAANSGDSPLMYMDDVDSDGEGIASSSSTEVKARQLAAQQQMMQMLMDSDTDADGDSWLIRQSGFRYET